MTPDQIIATVAALLASAPDPAFFPSITAGGANPHYPVTAEACPRPLAAGEIEGESVIRGRVDVPERHEAPDGRPISLAFGVQKSRSLASTEDPVVQLHGGPGGGAVNDLSTLVHILFDEHGDTREVVTFDQRAANLSFYMVTCFNTVEGNIFELFTGTGDDTQMETMLSNCMTELNEGRDIAAHTTPENARDVQALMRTLGYTEWNLYGVSYGTKLAFDVMRSAPEGTKAVVIDSVAPPNSRSYDENMLPISEGIDAVVRPSAENAACNAAFPDFRATILRMADELHKSPSPANADDRR